MKSGQMKYYFIVLSLILLGACTLPSPLSAPVSPESSEAPSGATLVTIDLAGPDMTLGSTYLYADGSVLVAVPTGIFTMGAAGQDNPKHQVNVSDFWMYSTKVTNGQYTHCVASGKCTPPPFQADNPFFDDVLHANDPMVGVNYEQASAYCGFVHARLPTEAEWEKAARGPEGSIYPWGDGAPSCDLLNYGTCVGNTTSVTNYPGGRSYYQAFDMEGNALEWVSDWYQADYYLNAPADDPQGPEKGQARAVRSSAFNSGDNQTQVFNRFYTIPDTHRDNLGFRCAVDDPTYFSPFCEYPATYGTDGIGGAGSGVQPEVTCPTLAINQSPACNGATPSTIVTMSIQQGWQLPFQYSYQGACTGSGFTYVCTGDAQFELCTECKVMVSIPPQCPDGYDWDANLMTCVGTGSPGECLPGSTYDETGQCCAFTPEIVAPTADALSNQTTTNASPHQNAVCPAGTWLYVSPGSPSHVECVAVPVQSPYCVSAGVQLLSCTPGGGGPQGCPAQSCGINYKWDSSSCSCVCDGC